MTPGPFTGVRWNFHRARSVREFQDSVVHGYAFYLFAGVRGIFRHLSFHFLGSQLVIGYFRIKLEIWGVRNSDEIWKCDTSDKNASKVPTTLTSAFKREQLILSKEKNCSATTAIIDDSAEAKPKIDIITERGFDFRTSLQSHDFSKGFRVFQSVNDIPYAIKPKSVGGRDGSFLSVFGYSEWSDSKTNCTKLHLLANL